MKKKPIPCAFTKSEKNQGFILLYCCYFNCLRIALSFYLNVKESKVLYIYTKYKTNGQKQQ